ncbi:MAG: DUF4239 domain-containing protein [Mycobacteriaceae bacterium]|nr:DUF4239 domain-containing protein [Mycobacteriaceae bacterium]
MSRTDIWLLLAAVMGGAIVIAVASVWLIHRSKLADRAEGATTGISVVAFVYGALLAFSVMASWQQFLSVQVVVADEASMLGTLYRQSALMPEPQQAQLKQLLRHYQSQVVNVEWPKHAGGEAIGGPDMITEMYRIVGDEPSGVAVPVIRPALLNNLGQLVDYRDMRIIKARSRMVSPLAGALIFGGVLLIALMGFMRIGSIPLHSIISGATAALLGLLLCLVYMLGHPYGVDRGISTKPFQRSVAVFDAVDRGP